MAKTPPEQVTDTSVGGNQFSLTGDHSAGPQPTNAQIVAAAAYAGVSPDAIRAGLADGSITASQVITAAGQQNNPTTSGDGSGSGGSSGGSGGSGGSGPSPQDIANAVEGYVQTFNTWGVPVTGAVRAWLSAKIKAGATSAAVLNAFRKTKAYAKAFPGIRNKNGTMKMTEAQYIAGWKQAQDKAASIGLNFGRQAYGYALKNHNSPSEIVAKIETEDRLKSFGPELREYNDYLMATGQIKKPLQRKDLREFLMGSRKDLEAGWETAHAAVQLQELAGVSVGKGKENDLRFRELQGMLKRFEGLGGDIEQIDFRKLGQTLSDVIPKSDLYGAGITRRDLVDMTLDGKGSADVARRAQNVIDTYVSAVSEPAAHAISYQGKVDLGTPKGATSE